ncbi:MAG: hypothetical protein ACYTER_11775, partial [Planctomycetota bacterium]
MKHLTEDMLIQYAFDLLEADMKAETAAHLADCADCTRQLELEADETVSEALVGKTLGGTAKSRSGGLRRPAVKPWVGWITAAAAVLVVGLLVTVDRESKSTITESEEPKTVAAAPMKKESLFEKEDVMVAAKPSDNHPALRAPLLDKEGSLMGDVKAERRKSPDGISESDIASTQTPQSGDSRPVAPGYRTTPPLRESLGSFTSSDAPTALAGAVGFDQAVRVVDADEIPDVAPFAPASAIELVVLPKPDATQVTIYNSADLTLVRDTRKLTLKPGWNWLQFMWDNTQIDPTSLSLRPLSHEKHVDIELISYPARLKDIGRWLIRSEVEGAVPFEITYFAGGLSWRAFYMGTMNADETSMNLKGYVNVANHSGQDFVNTQTRLIVGQTRLLEQIGTLAQRQRPYGPEIQVGSSGSIMAGSGVINLDSRLRFKDYNGRDDAIAGAVDGDADFYFYNDDDFYFYNTPDIKQIEKTGLSEYFLYTIEGTEDLTNRWSRRLPSLDVTDIPVKSLYKYDDQKYGSRPVRFVSFANDTEHELGETPIPEGAIKIYRNLNEVQNLSYVGQSNVKYIPVNEDVELNLGPARLVKVEPTLMHVKTDNFLFNHKGNIDGWDDIETWQVKVTNTRDIPIDIEITRNFQTTTWELELDENAQATEYKK